ncbi:MAG: dipeptidase [Synergistaceae bacterium]|jgi:membrane dipeptidase|nr:dipeptidase [Synergistaceae bacterium]
MEERFLAQARELIADSFAMDAHFDLAMDLDDRRELGAVRVYSDRHDGLVRAGGWNCLVSSLFIHSWQIPEMALRKALDQISALISEEREQPDKIALCGSMSEVDAANAGGRVGIMVSFEGADPLGCDIRLLQAFYRLGVRALGLTWSRRNYAADGCSFRPRKEGTRGGLTDFGIALLEEAERLGMVIDVSHLNDEGVTDAARHASRPFIASHSNCRALVPVMRNLTDEQIKLIAAKGGVIGMNCASPFVSSDVRDDIGAMELSSHIDHIVSLAGDDCVGLGLDCCDRLADYHVSVPNIKSYDTIPDHSHLPMLAAVLLEKGFGEDSVRKIIGGNFRRVYREITG